MTKYPTPEKNSKIQMPNSDFDSAAPLSCFVIPLFLGLSGFEPRLALIAPGGGELLVIMLVLILLFGAKDAPRILRNIQDVLNKLQRSAADFRYKLMYGDLHWNQTDESKDTTVYDEEDLPEEEDHDLPPEDPPSNEPEKHEESV